SGLIEAFLKGNLAILLLIISLLAGAIALIATPREEEPQIVVPLADVMVTVPGSSAEEGEQLVSSRLEKMLYQIDGVEYVYSMSRPGMAIVTVRFYVGQDREATIKVHDLVG
ncbi:MAG: efflux RND transporter permease subunit, partial [Actinomycetes bacterium]